MTKPRDPAQQKPPEPSAPVAPEIVFAWERFGLIAREFPNLFQKHWREIALNQDKIPLDPDWNRYFDYDLLGILQVLTARANGVIVGYIFVFVHPHLHYASTIWAQTDIFWLDPAYRFSGQGLMPTGYKLFRLMEQRLREMGVRVAYVNMKLHFEAARGTLRKMLLRLGYNPTEEIFSKFLG